jgi:hypothetical protein
MQSVLFVPTLYLMGMYIPRQWFINSETDRNIWDLVDNWTKYRFVYLLISVFMYTHVTVSLPCWKHFWNTASAKNQTVQWIFQQWHFLLAKNAVLKVLYGREHRNEEKSSSCGWKFGVFQWMQYYTYFIT